MPRWDSAVGRWSGIRLWVYRGAGDQATYAVIHRRWDGGLQRDQLLAHGTISTAPGSPASVHWESALTAALKAALEGQDQAYPSAPAEAGVPLGGPQGGALGS